MIMMPHSWPSHRCSSQARQTSGTPQADPGGTWTPQQVVRLAVAHGPQGPPGASCYSNANYIILGMIAQAVTGEPIQELITSRVLRPLHLSHTSFPAAAAPPALIAQGYTVDQGVAAIATAAGSPADISVSGAAGAMISTVADLQIRLPGPGQPGPCCHPRPSASDCAWARRSGSSRRCQAPPAPARLPFRYGAGNLQRRRPARLHRGRPRLYRGHVLPARREGHHHRPGQRL
jgi:CubicO group peptidase (beta-lactamase class C family)